MLWRRRRATRAFQWGLKKYAGKNTTWYLSTCTESSLWDPWLLTLLLTSFTCAAYCTWNFVCIYLSVYGCVCDTLCLLMCFGVCCGFCVCFVFMFVCNCVCACACFCLLVCRSHAFSRPAGTWSYHLGDVPL